MVNNPSRSFLVASAATVLLAACADDVVRPLDVPAPTFSASAGAPDLVPTGRHMVLFRGNAVPFDFADQVAAVGGRLENAMGPLGTQS